MNLLSKYSNNSYLQRIRITPHSTSRRYLFTPKIFTQTTFVSLTILLSLFGVAKSSVAATTTLSFTNTPTLVSGTARSQGAVYRFANVAPGTDAMVQVATIQNAQLKAIDDNTSFPDRFQPTIAPNSVSLINSQSYVRFNFKLIPSSTPSGTSFAAAPVLTATNVYFSAQDVDGNSGTNTIREFVEVIGALTSYVANPTLLQPMSNLPVPGGIGYEQQNSANVQPGIGTDDRYEFYSYLGTSVGSFSIVGGNITGTAGCTLNNTGCDRLNSWTFNVADVQKLDWGDAPSSYGDAYHPVPLSPSVYLGTSVEGDDGPNYTASANGDDITGIDDEDGISSFPTLLTNSTSYSLNLTCAGTNTPVSGWIDFNRDGSFSNTTEKASGTCNGSTVTLNWTSLSGLSAGNVYARFRTASIASEVTNPTGQASNGEVEDYQIAITQANDYGDAPSSFGDASHNISTTPTIYLGSVKPDPELATQLGTDSGASASGDDNNGTPDDEDAFTSLPNVPIVGNYNLTVPVTNSSGSAATLHAWIDFNKNGKFEATEYKSAAVASGNTSANLSWTVPANAVIGSTHARFRLTSNTLSDNIATTTVDERSIGNVSNGEVEDYPVSISTIYDYGDAPDTGTGTGTGNYRTTASDGGAAQIKISTAGQVLSLGSNIDSDDGTLQDVNAQADDTNGTPDDEDGVTSFPTLTTTANQTYTVPVTVQNNVPAVNAFLVGYIDFNKDGDFNDTGEKSATVTVPTSNTNPRNFNVTFTTPAGMTTGNTYARFRLGQVQATAESATGASISTDNGEVEDYQIAIASSSPPAVCETIYGSYNNGNNLFNSLRTYTPRSSLSAEIATLDTAPSNAFVATVAVDPLLDSNNRRRIYYAEFQTGSPRLFYYDGVNKVDTGITIPIPSATVNVTKSTGAITTPNNGIARMGFAPDGTLYISDAQKTLYRFTPNRSGTGGTRSSAIIIADNPNNDTGNSFRAQIGKSYGGDVAFDSAGRMYIVAYDPETNGFTSTEFRLFQIKNPQDTNPEAVLLGKFATTDTIAGLAFKFSDNKLYLQGTGGRSFSWDLGTNTVSLLGTTATGSTDLGSCTYPNLNPDSSGAFTKTVSNLTNPGATILTANDVLEYTLSLTNNGNLAAGNVTLQDTIPTNTTYVPNTTKLNGTTLPDDPGGVMPYATTRQVNSPGQASGVLLTGSANKATVVFRVKVNASNTRVCNQGTFNYDGAPAGIVSDNPSTSTASDSTCTGNLIDYGDAPDTGLGTAPGNYQTTTSDGDPSHTIVSGIALGANIDADSGTLQNLNADADDTNGNPNDEDGVKLGETSLQNQTLTIGNNVTLNITTQGSGSLSAWIDLNQDGDFLDIGEKIATDLTPTSNAISLPFTIPTGTTPGTTYARFRYSTQTGLASTGTASNGEIEDYQIAIATASDPNLLLVKRVTAINPGRDGEIQFDTFVDDGTLDNEDNDPNWPDGDDTYLPGAISVDDVRPGDEVEYTIYFLSNGNEDAANVQICDVIPDNMSFVSNGFDNDSGIALLNSSVPGATATNLSNVNDTDEGTFYAPGTALPTIIVGDPPETKDLCQKVDSVGNTVGVNAGNNVNGAVIVELETLPKVNSPGDPVDSYGFIRFRAKVQ